MKVDLNIGLKNQVVRQGEILKHIQIEGNPDRQIIVFNYVL